MTKGVTKLSSLKMESKVKWKTSIDLALHKTLSFTGKGNPSIVAILEENKRLKQDKERLAEKLSQSKGALRETLDRLHKKDASTLRLLEQRFHHINL